MTIHRISDDFARPVSSGMLLVIELCKAPASRWTTPAIADMALIEPGNVREGMRRLVDAGLVAIVEKGKAGRLSGAKCPRSTVYGAGPELLRLLGQ